MAITTPIMLLAGLQLNAIQITDMKGEFSFEDYFSLRSVAALAGLLLVIVIILASGFRRETALVILLLALAKTVDAIADVFLSGWQQREEMRVASALWMLNALSSLLLTLVAISLTGSVAWAAAGSLAGSLVALVGAVALRSSVPCGNGGFSLPRWHLDKLTRLAALALPMGGVVALLSLNVNVPRYFVQHYLGESALGLFAAAAYPMAVADLLMSSLALSASPRMASYHAANDRHAFKTLLSRLTLIGAVTGGAAVAVAIIAGRQILTWLYRPEYSSQAVVFVWIVVAASFRYTFVFVGVAITAMRLFLLQFYLRAGMFVVLLVTSPLLIRRFGLTGGALAMVLVAIVEGMVWLGIGYTRVWRWTGGPSMPAVSTGA
jgi:O-antigen/teichoic acid export membrane protein